MRFLWLGKALLLNTDLPIHEIAAACGFRDAHNFSRATDSVPYDTHKTPANFFSKIIPTVLQFVVK